MTAATPARGRAVGLLGVLAALAFMATMTTVIVAIAIWPGEASLTAPLFCDADQPDAFVVSDTYHPAPGETVTNYTMYCVGPRGDSTEIGFGKPFLALTIAHGILFTALGMAVPILGGVGRIGRKRAGVTDALDQATLDDLRRRMGATTPSDDVDWPGSS